MKIKIYQEIKSFFLFWVELNLEECPILFYHHYLRDTKSADISAWKLQVRLYNNARRKMNNKSWNNSLLFLDYTAFKNTKPLILLLMMVNDWWYKKNPKVWDFHQFFYFLKHNYIEQHRIKTIWNPKFW